MSAWTSTINDTVQMKEFAQELSFEYKSSGTWKGDYEYYSAKLGILSCPSFSINHLEDGKCACKLANRIIDIASWRSFLLACVATGSTVSEIAIHNCQMSPLHFSDLCLALEKIGRLDVLKMDYIDLTSTMPVIISAPIPVTKHATGHTPTHTPSAKKRSSLKLDTEDPIQLSVFGQLFSCNCTIDYISLRGNRFSDEFITVMQPVLSNNVTIQSLNLSDNSLTDTGITRLFHILKSHYCLRHVALRKNMFTGQCLEGLAALIVGATVTPEDDHALKSVVKIISEKNKVIKEVNKKRKKGGQQELEELPAFTTDQRIIKIDKNNTVALNRSLSTVDLSCNQIDLSSLSDFANTLNEKSAQPLIAAITCDIQISFRGIFTTEADIEMLNTLEYPDGINVIHVISE